MRLTLDAIDQAIYNEISVYVHCLGGRGRTGTVVGCYLIRHGLADRADVFDAIRGIRAAKGLDRAGSSRTTHGARATLDGCRFLAALILGALQGHSKDELLSPNLWPVSGEV